MIIDRAIHEPKKSEWLSQGFHMDHTSIWCVFIFVVVFVFVFVVVVVVAVVAVVGVVLVLPCRAPTATVSHVHLSGC